MCWVAVINEQSVCSVYFLFPEQRYEWGHQFIKSLRIQEGMGQYMTISRFLTGIVAGIVLVFSISMFGILIRMNSAAVSMEPLRLQDAVSWEGISFAGELRVKEGRFEKLTVYRR